MSEHPGGENPDPDIADQLPPAPPWLAELLASLPADDPPIPEHVAARLDAALAVLTPGRPVTTPGAGSGSGSAREDSTTTDTTATVVPLAAGSRHRDRAGGRSRLGHRLLLGGVAAAAVVVLGGLGTVAVLRGEQPAGGPATTAGNSSVGPASTAPTAYLASAQDFTPANLATGARALLAHAAGSTPTSPAPATSQQTPTSLGQTGGTVSTPLVVTPATVRPSAGCLTELTGSATVTALVADETTYDGAPVFVVLSPTLLAGTQAVDPTHVDVWVVRRACSADDAAVITFIRITR